ncbi:MAG: hypothetical protein A3F10_06345 [Coxiella sp. RIFCSPHIGHO2_12_FULL_42_15]|nr:MAG: hypothetical protein A3F10_06345 [Coxiella sp. RIFCSPHIGHO2_12_FULL_42_15]
MPFFESERYVLRKENIDNIIQAIKNVGHCVIEKTWDINLVDYLYRISDQYFNCKDEAWFSGKMPDGELNQYFGAFYDVFDAVSNDKFFNTIKDSCLPLLFNKMLNGKFVIMQNERSARRVDPKFPVRISGFHVDGQLSRLSSQGYHTQDEFTMWSPLRDAVDERTPRLLLLHQSENDNYLKINYDQVTDIGDKQNIPILALSKLNLALEKNHSAEIITKRDKAYRVLFEKLKCYAPKLQKGDVILYDKSVWHSTYAPENFSNKMISLDFRIVGDHPPISDAGWGGKVFNIKKTFLGRNRVVVENY